MSINNNDQQKIEKVFIASWDYVSKFYILYYFWDDPEWEELSEIDLSVLGTPQNIANHHSRWKWLKPIQGLIAEMQKRGYDRQLRAGQSLHTLILSRSRDYDLRAGQATVHINLRKEGGMTVSYWEKPDRSIEITTERVEITPEVEQLLARLLAQPID